MPKPFELRLTRGELELLINLIEYEHGNAMASRPVEKRRTAELLKLVTKLATDLSTRF